MERPAGQTEVAGIRLNHDDRITEAVTQVLGSPRVCLDGNYASARENQRRRQRSDSGADVDDDGARGDSGVSDEPVCPRGVELVPRPLPLCGGHGDGP
jgi:hypothetical protein